MINFGNFVPHLQNLSLPLTIINYVAAKKPRSNPKIYYKLYFCCKYFYNKLKILPCFYATCSKSKMHACSIVFDYPKKTSVSKDSVLSGDFILYNIGSLYIEDNTIPLSSLISKHWLTPVRLTIFHQTLTLDEFKKLTTKTINLRMHRTLVLNFNGNTVPVEEILECLPNADNFDFCPKNDLPGQYTSETAAKLASLKREKKFEEFALKYVPEDFDGEDFANFVLNKSVDENNNRSEYIIKFAPTVPIEIIKIFQNIYNDHLKSWEKQTTKPQVILSYSR